MLRNEILRGLSDPLAGDWVELLQMLMYGISKAALGKWICGLIRDGKIGRCCNGHKVILFWSEFVGSVTDSRDIL